MSTLNQEYDTMSAFGLTPKQTALMFSLEVLCTRLDAASEKNVETKSLKDQWLTDWKLSIEKHLNSQQLKEDEKSLVEAFQEELGNSNSKTWYYLIILEAVTFRAYTSLGGDRDKLYSKLKYTDQVAYIKLLISEIGTGSPETADRYARMYEKAINKGAGKAQKRVIKALSVLAAGAITAATAGALAGPISVALFGSQFAGLGGAALVNACLAFIGGGAIAAGGAGIAGGVLTIVGGGALLGAAGGGATVTVFSLIARATPELALSQAAKLDVVLREIILNEQQDIKAAQDILKKYKDHIAELNKELSLLKSENEQNKSDIKNLTESIGYMERIFKDLMRFTSSFEVGIETTNYTGDEIEK